MEKLLKEKLKNGRFDSVSAIRSKMMKTIKGKGNKSTEIKFCNVLTELKILGWETHVKLIGNPDVLFPHYKIAIFLDGCFWHGCPDCGHIPKTNYQYWKAKIERNIQRDTEKMNALKEEGYIVIRFWEHEINNELEKCITYLIDTIEDRLLKIVNQSY